MKTYLGHLIHSTWFTLTWEAALALLVFFSGIGISLTGNGYLKVMGVLAAVSALIALACIPLVELTKTYWKTLYRDQGMFTHTLPIAKGKIFAAHGIWFSICSFIFGGIFCLAIFSWIIIIKGSPSLAALVEIKQALYTYKGTVFVYSLSCIITSICGTFTFLASISVGMHSKLYGRLGIAAPVLAVVLVVGTALPK